MSAHHGPDDICDLLVKMKLEEPEFFYSSTHGGEDVVMEHQPQLEPIYHGCAYLQAIQSQIHSYATTNGEYLEAIFTHREILSAYPVAHRDCAHGLLALAAALENRGWRADRDADTEAVSAFRHEAEVVSAAL